MTDDVVYLAYKNPEVQAESGIDMLACRRCRNKTWRLECYEDDCAASVHCAGCGAYAGKMGWIHGNDTVPA